MKSSDGLDSPISKGLADMLLSEELVNCSDCYHIHPKTRECPKNKNISSTNYSISRNCEFFENRADVHRSMYKINDWRRRKR